MFRVHFMMCAGTSCVSGGSLHVKDALIEELKKHGLEDEVGIYTTGCNGFCAAGPLMISYPEGVFYQKISVEDIPHFVEEYFVKARVVQKHLFKDPVTGELIPKLKDIAFFNRQTPVALRNRSLIDPENIDEYIARDGYAAVARALFEMSPEEIVQEMLLTTTAERQGRVIDGDNSSMEDKKKDGYF